MLQHMERTSEAINLFKEKYGKTPNELGFSVVGIYEKQHAFLYATTEEVIEAYKTQQNIIRWVMAWYFGPLALVMVNFVGAVRRYQDGMHWRCLATYVFLAVWGLLITVLWLKVKKADKLVKLGENVIFLNY